MLLSLLDDRPLDLTAGRAPLRRAPRLGGAVDRLAADLHDARHHRRAVALGDELTGVGDALAHSHARKAFPASSSS